MRSASGVARVSASAAAEASRAEAERAAAEEAERQRLAELRRAEKAAALREEPAADADVGIQHQQELGGPDASAREQGAREAAVVLADHHAHAPGEALRHPGGQEVLPGVVDDGDLVVGPAGLDLVEDGLEEWQIEMFGADLLQTVERFEKDLEAGEIPKKRWRR